MQLVRAVCDFVLLLEFHGSSRKQVNQNVAPLPKGVSFGCLNADMNTR